jgi:hypothetical protein
MRDKMVTNLCGGDSNFFSLNESKRSQIRKDVVMRYLGENPAWLVRWENSLADLSKQEFDMVRPFACNLIASRMATIWQSEMAQVKKTSSREKGGCGKKRGRNEGAVEICEDCSSELQIIRICPHCDAEHPNKKPAVFLP